MYIKQCDTCWCHVLLIRYIVVSSNRHFPHISLYTCTAIHVALCLSFSNGKWNHRTDRSVIPFPHDIPIAQEFTVGDRAALCLRCISLSYWKSSHIAVIITNHFKLSSYCGEKITIWVVAELSLHRTRETTPHMHKRTHTHVT